MSPLRDHYLEQQASLCFFGLMGFIIVYPLRLYQFKVLHIYLAIFTTFLVLFLLFQKVPTARKSFLVVLIPYALPAVTYVWSSYPVNTQVYLLGLLPNVFLGYIAVYMAHSEKTRSIGFAACVFPLVLTLLALFLILYFGSFRPTDRYMADVTGSISNHAAGICALCVPLIIWARRHGQVRLWLANTALVSVLFVGFASQSRAAIVIIPVTIVISFAILKPTMLGKIFALMRVFFLLGMTLVAFLLFPPTSEILSQTYERLENSDVSQYLGADPSRKMSDYGRALMYSEGRSLIAEYFPQGAGGGALKPYMEESVGRGLISHNIGITILGELGVVGILGWILFFGVLAKAIRRLLRSSDRIVSDLGRVGVVFMAVFLVYSQVRPFESNYMFPIGVAFLLSFSARIKYRPARSVYEVDPGFRTR